MLWRFPTLVQHFYYLSSWYKNQWHFLHSGQKTEKIHFFLIFYFLYGKICPEPWKKNPLGSLFRFSFGDIAQLVEQMTFNHWVQGSSPCVPTTITRGHPRGFCFWVSIIYLDFLRIQRDIFTSISLCSDGQSTPFTFNTSD